MFIAYFQEWTHIVNPSRTMDVTWRFNSPSASRFGGKWEAGIKSVKFHLRQVIGDTLFIYEITYEKLSTLLIQIKAILNSRPLAAFSDDSSNASAFIPEHFLVRSALATVPEPSLEELFRNRLSRLQLLRQMTESFWQ